MCISVSLFIFQLFDHVGEAEVTLRNTGKVGFKFSIIHPQKEDETDEEAEGQRKVLEKDEKQPDLGQREDSGQNEEGQKVKPGQPMAIPAWVRLSWGNFIYEGVIHYV